jgi:hypothetical protein
MISTCVMFRSLLPKILKTANMTQNSWEKLEPIKSEARAKYTAKIPMINITETLFKSKENDHQKPMLSLQTTPVIIVNLKIAKGVR